MAPFLNLYGDQTMAPDTVVNRSDTETLRKLNADFISSVQMSDVRRFEEILAEDFLNSNPDCTLVDRKTFLAQIARPPMISNLEAEDVRVRIMGDIAIIHARTTYTKPDGQAGAGRYTDVWAHRKGRWLCVSAQVTRA
jgi:ketosteroid isomerase-like protein